MKVAMLSPIAWRTPPRHYGPWENIVSLLTEQLVSLGVEVTLFASGDSHTSGNFSWVCESPYSENPNIDPKVWECLHIAELFKHGDEFDVIHNHYDFLPLSYSEFTQTPVITTIHGFSSPSILPVYKKYNAKSYYIAVSEADKRTELNYLATIHHGIDLKQFPFVKDSGDYLLFLGRIHPEKGVHDAIEIAIKADRKLIIAGIIQDHDYFQEQVEPFIDGKHIEYLGAVGPDKRQTLLGGAYATLNLIHFEQSFALNVIESMACGTPVIAFNRGAMPELIRHGQTGFIVDDQEGVLEAVKKINAIDRRQCRAEIEQHFTCQRMARDYLKAYQRVIKERENYRPWGHYQDLLEHKDHKIKELYVKPGSRLSLQKHFRRAEHWVVVSGEALVTIGRQEKLLKPGQSIDIPKGEIHRIENPLSTDLVIVEVQTGDYFGEDDIVRIQDDYNRWTS